MPKQEMCHHFHFQMFLYGYKVLPVAGCRLSLCIKDNVINTPATQHCRSLVNSKQMQQTNELFSQTR